MVRPANICRHDGFQLFAITFFCVCIVTQFPVGHACYRRSSSECFYGFRTEGEIVVLGYLASIENGVDGTEPSFIAFPQLRRSELGLISGHIKLFIRRSFDLEDLNIEVRDGRGDLSESELQETRTQIIALAQQDPLLRGYNPGGPPITQLNPTMVYNFCANAGLVLGIPAYLYMCAFFAFEQMRNERRDAGVCIHCQYDCKGLHTPICPECGREHGSEVEVVA